MTDNAPRKNTYTDTAEAPTDVIVTLRIRPELNEKTAIAAQAVGLRKSDIMRLALDRGIDRLLEQLHANQEAAQ
jgi:hypothetical protein